ncbi:NfeD family protein [Sphingomonas ginsenosidivorax]|uniref:NfeD family protein n=1 Tax=Sphingomonas ginsenosidivorax TaxID=862135 RepID=A0A5C6UCS0_9SPHN|nr:NfeD family protein [Sphingomonas ginsenosidivorax]TXC70499.1 NfeD family protein [Sphingomonas ginsenosidivorax]
MGAIGASSAWLIAALLLGIAELAVPGVFLVFLAIAAAATGFAVFALPDLPVTAQLGSFAAWSVVTVLIGKRWYVDYPVEGGDPMLNDRAARLVGEIVTVETAIIAGHGRVVVGDGGWPARGADAAVGTRMRVVAVEGGTVVVEPLEA